MHLTGLKTMVVEFGKLCLAKADEMSELGMSKLKIECGDDC